MYTFIDYLEGHATFQDPHARKMVFEYVCFIVTSDYILRG